MAGSGEAAAPRWLVVIDPGQRALFELLRNSLKPDAPFQVILDRRRGDRRRVDGNGVPGPERRREDRRRQKPAGGLYVGTVVPAGEPPPPAPRPRAATPTGVEHEVVTAACATCWDVLSFELPRFPKPPARLDAEVIHERGPSSTQHYAEIQAFTISGRRLLVQRVQAVRKKT